MVEEVPGDLGSSSDGGAPIDSHVTEPLGRGASGAEALCGALGPGARFGRYRILRPLGEGGMGTVVLAYDERLGREVALKIPRETSAAARVRFVREGRAVAALEDPHVVRIFDVGEVDGSPYLCMEHIEGRPLRALLHDESVDTAQRVALIADLARGLQAAHRAGLVHRDVKPDNVIVRPSGRCVLIDFGVACQAPDATTPEASLTHTGGVVGTPSYMAPEQLRAQDVDARADQFAWGTVAFELLTGQHPFGREGAPTVVAILEAAPPALRDLRPDVAPHVAIAIGRALAKSRTHRFADMTSLLAALEDGATPHQARWTATRIATLASVVAAVVVGGAFTAGDLRVREATPARASPSAIATADAPASPSSTPIDALPTPDTAVPAAASAYRAGLRALQDNDWDRARAHFERATKADPEMAAAHVQRLVTELDSDARDIRKLREIYNSAWRLRAALSPRDRALLEAHEPHVGREPQDTRAYRVRIAEAARRFPGDVQLALLDAMEVSDSTEAVEAFDHVLALDPRCANALQLKARHLVMLGRTDEALAVLEQCVAISPGSQCLEQRVALWAEQGECARMESDAHEWVAKSAGGTYAYYLLANALAGHGDDAAALEALHQRSATLSGEARVIAEAVEPARLEVLRGRFGAAETRARALLEAIEGSANVRPHAAATSLLVDILLETGRAAEAGRAAQAFLARAPAWNRDGGIDDGIPIMLGALARAERSTPAESEARAAAWIEEKKASGYVLMFPYLAAYAHAGLLRTPADAEVALRSMALPFPHGQAYLPVMPARGLYGRALALAGQPGARQELGRAARSCAPLEDPFLHTRAQLWWGLALEADQDHAGACAAYAAVAKRWGAATPPSESATLARARSTALACDGLDPDGGAAR